MNTQGAGAKDPRDGWNINYLAPELLLELEDYEKNDSWTVGCILYELVTGLPLFDFKDAKEIIYIIKNLHFLWKS